MRRAAIFLCLLMSAAWAGVCRPSAHATIVATGNFTGTGTPYNGTDDPWAVGPGTVRVGDTATASLTINGGSKVTNSGSAIVAEGGGATTSSVVVDGAGSEWTNASFLTIGRNGRGTLDITGGGKVTNTTSNISNSFGPGVVTVGGGSGTSTWMQTGAMTIGASSGSNGRLDIVGGGTVSNASTNVGGSGGSVGLVNVGGGTGSSTWTNTGQLFVASGGSNGTMNITGGGSVSSGTGLIATANPAIGTVTIGGGTGASSWTISGALTVGQTGFTGTATLNINTGGLVAAGALEGGNVNSSVKLDGGTLRITATDSASNTINLLSGGGTIDVPNGATTFTLTGSVGGAGGLTKTGDGMLVLDGTVSYGGGTTISGGTVQANNPGGLGSVNVADGATLGGTGTVSGVVTVAAGGAVSPGNSIAALTVGGLTLTDATSKLALEFEVDATPAADLLNLTGGISIAGSTLSLSLLIATPGTTQTFLVISNDSNDSIAGTFGTITGLPPGWTASLDYGFSGVDMLNRTGDGNDLAIVLSNVPEARGWIMTGAVVVLGACVRLGRKRRRQLAD